VTPYSYQRFGGTCSFHFQVESRLIWRIDAVTPTSTHADTPHDILLPPAAMSYSIYRVIHKSLRDVRPLRYSSRDGHAGGEHVNRGTDTPKFLSYLTGIDMLLSAVSVLVAVQPSSEVPEGLTNYPVYLPTRFGNSSLFI
jgi:hypothetical protein